MDTGTSSNRVESTRCKSGVLRLCTVISIMSMLVDGVLTVHAQPAHFSLPNIYAVPDAPAFALLGEKTESMLGRGTTRDLAVHIGTFSDGAHVPIGSAVEWAPLRMWWLRSWSLKEYQERSLLRTLMNSRVSLGTRADTVAGGTVVSVGWRCTLLDASDLRLDTVFIARSMRILEGMHEYSMTAVREANRQREAAGRTGLSEEEKNSTLKRANDEYKKLKLAEWTALRDREAPKRWNRTRIDVALAELYRSNTTLWKDLRVERAAAWLNAQCALDDSSSALAGGASAVLQRSTQHSTMDSLSFSAALRFTYGSNVTSVYCTIDVAHSSLNDHITQQGRLAFGLNTQLGTGIWLDATLGASFERGSKPRIIFSLQPRFGSVDADFQAVGE